MTGSAWLAFYSLAVLGVSLLGGYFPFIGRITHSKLQFYLSLSAGVMLGAAFFHVMPEAMEYSGPMFGWWMSLGVVGLFCIERFIAPHSHELDNGGHHRHEKHAHDHGPGEHKHLPEEAVEHAPSDHRAAAPAVAGWMAVLGLTIHTFMNGVGLAGAVQADAQENHSFLLWGLALPGLAMFSAIVCHKPFDALAISTVLSRKGVSNRVITLVQIGFALMVPIGAVAFLAAGEALETGLRSQLTGAALAFSAGTFLFIALSDLLPEVQFHRHDRLWLFLMLTLGVAFMGGIALMEGHEHGHDEHAPALQSKSHGELESNGGNEKAHHHHAD